MAILEVGNEREDNEAREARAAHLADARLRKTRDFLQARPCSAKRPEASTELFPDHKREHSADFEGDEPTTRKRTKRANRPASESGLYAAGNSNASSANGSLHSVDLNAFDLEARRSRWQDADKLSLAQRTSTAATTVARMFSKSSSRREGHAPQTREGMARRWYRGVATRRAAGELKTRLSQLRGLSLEHTNQSAAPDPKELRIVKLESNCPVTSLGALSLHDVHRLKREQKQFK